MIASLTAQTNDAWYLVLIDDGSTAPETSDTFSDIRNHLGPKVSILSLDRNRGQGYCRNVGIRAAWEKGIDTVAFIDADDIADPARVARLAETFADRADVDFIYSGFEPIDQEGRLVDASMIAPSIREILDALEAPPSGEDAWRRIAVETGYVTLTSTVAVRTDLAMRNLFPTYYVSEDQHAWLRMTSASRCVAYDQVVKAQYRIMTDGSGSSVRARIGEGYYEQKAWVDSEGFFLSLDIALSRGRVSPAEAPILASRFLERCATTLAGQGYEDIAGRYRRLARRAAGAGFQDLAAFHPPKPPMFDPSRRAG